MSSESQSPINPALQADNEIREFLEKIKNNEQIEKKPVPPRSESPELPKQKPKELCTSRVHRFRDWCEIVGIPSEEIEEYAEKLKKHFNEHDEDSEQEEHESYQEEMDEWRDEMMDKALTKFEEMDEDYEKQLDEKYRRRRGFPPPSSTPMPQEYEYSKGLPNWNETDDQDVIYD